MQDFKELVILNQMRSASNRMKKSDTADCNILRREAKAINATVEWFRKRSTVDITVTAPTGFVWASTGERDLTCECSYDQCRDAVSELLVNMASGFDRALQPHTHEHDCECDECENSDDELFELAF